MAYDKANYIKHKAQKLRRVKEKREADVENWRRRERAQTLARTYKKIKHITREAPANCEACGILLSDTAKGPCLDHCHLTGMFRGWLCHKCNSALGLAGDTPEAVRRLLEYIERAYDAIRLLS